MPRECLCYILKATWTSSLCFLFSHLMGPLAAEMRRKIRQANHSLKPHASTVCNALCTLTRTQKISAQPRASRHRAALQVRLGRS